MTYEKKQKPKKKKSVAKPRTAYTYFTSKEEISTLDITFNPVDQSFSTTTPITNAYHQVTYERDGKSPKALNITPVVGERFHLDANDALRSFDYVIAIDTNDKVICGEQHSSTGVVIAKWQSSPEDQKHGFFYETPFCVDYVALKSPREIIGWCVALQHLKKIGLILSSAKIGVVVDSCLEEIPRFNTRSIPLYGEFYLPEQFTLIYASADAGGEFIANQLLKSADKAATMTLEYLASNSNLPYPAPTYAGPWDKIRFILNNKST